jgi:hypothetical protein
MPNNGSACLVDLTRSGYLHPVLSPQVFTERHHDFAANRARSKSYDGLASWTKIFSREFTILVIMAGSFSMHLAECDRNEWLQMKKHRSECRRESTVSLTCPDRTREVVVTFWQVILSQEGESADFRSHLTGIPRPREPYQRAWHSPTEPGVDGGAGMCLSCESFVPGLQVRKALALSIPYRCFRDIWSTANVTVAAG